MDVKKHETETANNRTEIVQVRAAQFHSQRFVWWNWKNLTKMLKASWLVNAIVRCIMTVCQCLSFHAVGRSMHCVTHWPGMSQLTCNVRWIPTEGHQSDNYQVCRSISVTLRSKEGTISRVVKKNNICSTRTDRRKQMSIFSWLTLLWWWILYWVSQPSIKKRKKRNERRKKIKMKGRKEIPDVNNKLCPAPVCGHWSFVYLPLLKPLPLTAELGEQHNKARAFLEDLQSGHQHLPDNSASHPPMDTALIWQCGKRGKRIVWKIYNDWVYRVCPLVRMSEWVLWLVRWAIVRTLIPEVSKNVYFLFWMSSKYSLFSCTASLSLKTECCFM